VEEQIQHRVVPTNGGRQIPSATTYYAITAAGIDRIEGASAFTPRDRFAGIHISANGDNTVIVGDGNQVSRKYELEANELAALSASVKQCADIDASTKMDAVVDIDTIQSQLARSSPNRTIMRSAWEALEPLSKIAALASAVVAVGAKLAPFFS